MARAETLEKIRTIVAEVCAINPATVPDHGKLAGFGIDSVRIVDVFLSIEEAFGVTISEADPALAGVETVRDLADYVERC